MAKKDHDREHETEGKYQPEPPHGGHRGHGGYGEEESGDDARRHASIIERRWLGSPPPTAERYTNALRQWQKLPGALPGPATPTEGNSPAKEREK